MLGHSENTGTTTENAIKITFKIKDDFDIHYDRNTENKLKASQVKEMLSKGVHTSFFQKQKPDDKSNKSRHRILIPIGEDRAVEARVYLSADRVDTFTEVYSYRIGKFKEVSFFNEPNKHTIKANCIFEFKDWNNNVGNDTDAFKQLYKSVEACEIPLGEVNKDKDVSIWKHYVVALKKLVKQKEQVWKIQNVSAPYSEKNTFESERANYIDIVIDESGLIVQLEKDIKALFNPFELEDYGVNADKAFIEFKNYRHLAQEEITKLKEAGEELFYELSSSSPQHYISGEYSFKYSDPHTKSEIFAEIKDKLISEYQLECNIDNDGCVSIAEEHIPHLQKLVTDNFGHLIDLKKKNEISVKVDFKAPQVTNQLKESIKQRLNKKDLSRANVAINSANNQIEIEVGAFINQNEFSQENLTFVKSISRFKPIKPVKLRTLPGFELSNGCFIIENATKIQAEGALQNFQSAFNGINFRRLPTIYVFQPSAKVSADLLRNFKTGTDIKGQSDFSLQKSVITIYSDSKVEYDQHRKRIQGKFPNVILADVPFKLSHYLVFKTDSETVRQSIFSRIQNEIRASVHSTVEFDVIKQNTRTLFSYTFKSENERDAFKEVIANICHNYKQEIQFSFDSSLGRTIYELNKNESLELEKEKEVAGNVRQATFVFLSAEQKDQLNEAVERFGDDAIFKEGVVIGKLIRKDKNRLKFKITEEFDSRLNARERDRLNLKEMQKGFVKPIFPGELTNINRMIKAMRKVTEPSVRIGYPVNRNLSNFLFDPNEARQSAEDINEEKRKILIDLNEPLLKDQPKQLEAVAKTLLAKDMSLIQGPPGTGKTTVIAEIIWQFLVKEPSAKILITSQTNLAVDNALERIKGKKLVRAVRIGNIEKFEDEGKVYSNDRIKKWLQAKNGSNEEIVNEDNAVTKWIDNVHEKCSEESKYGVAIEKWKKGLATKSAEIKEIFSQAYYKRVNIFAATCSECGSPRFTDAFHEAFQKYSDSKTEPEFDLVIMDEASKATPPELVLPLTLGKKVVIIGDHKQLPPMIDEEEFSEALEAVGAKSLIEYWTKDDYKVSQFEKLFKNSPKNFVTSLDTQFRMHEQIMSCISQFYTDQPELENGLICGIKGEMDIADLNVKASRWHGLKMTPFIEPKHHAIWVNVESPESRVGTSFENTGELDAIQTVLRLLTKSEGFKDYYSHFKRDEDKEIGIITYYMPQMQNLRQKLYPSFGRNEWRNFEQHKFENEFQIPLRINTVDRFQGMERNIIIISTVRSNKQFKEEQGKKLVLENNRYPFALGFARELQRINVGFSRAKRLLIVVGNEKHFSHKPEYAEAIRKMHRVDIMQIKNLIL